MRGGMGEGERWRGEGRGVGERGEGGWDWEWEKGEGMRGSERWERGGVPVRNPERHPISLHCSSYSSHIRTASIIHCTNCRAHPDQSNLLLYTDLSYAIQ